MAKLPVPMPPPGEMLRRRREEMGRRRTYLTLGRRLFLLTAALWIILSQVIMIHRNQGLGMFPAIKDGDLTVSSRLWRELEKDDVVVYRMGGRLQIGRIVATERDVVKMDDSGSLLINGSVQNGQILYPTYARKYAVYPQRIPEGSVYVLGDHRTQSLDSRDHGSVPLDDILGKVIVVIRMRGL